jgi:hypothetical protein
MSVNEIHPYNFPTSHVNDFERKGHPGKFLRSITCGTGTTHFTGSNYGVGGIIVPSGTTVKVDSGTVYVLIKNQLSK